MIVLRRALAVFLVIVFPSVFLLTLLALRVNATVLEPSFYTNTLSRVDAYNFIYDEVLPSAIQESGVDLNDVPLGLELTPEEVVEYLRETIPPAWLEENVSGVIGQFVPYATGRTDSFVIQVRLDDRVEAAGEVIREIAQEAKVHDFLIDDIVRPDLERNESAFQDLPFGVRLTVDQVADGVKEVIPEEWLKTQVLGVLDELIPYATARNNSFRVVIPLQERADAGIAVLQRWFAEGLDDGGYDHFIDEQITPVVRAGVGDGIDLPFGVVITDDEVVEAVAETLPPEWVSDRVSEAIESIGNYLTGRSDVLLVVIPMEDRFLMAAEALVEVADTRLETAYNSLPPCTSQQLQEMNSSPQEPPECKIPNRSYQQIKEQAGYDILDELAMKMIEPLPGNIELDESMLLRGFGESDIENVRRLLRDGFVFEDGDLRAMLLDQGGPDLVETFEDVRAYMLEGFQFTDEDLRAQNDGGYEVLGSVRETIGTARGFLFLMLIAPLGVVASVGFLGGRSWGTRLAWAGVPLVIGGLLIGITAWVGGSQIRSLTDGVILGLEANEPILGKLAEARDELVRVFITPLAIQSAIVGLVGASAVGGGFYLERRLRGGEIAPDGPDGQPLETEAMNRDVMPVPSGVSEPGRPTGAF